MSLSSREQLHQVRERAHAKSESWPSHEVQFRVETGWAQTYDEIFSGRFSSILTEDAILDSVLKRGRAILAGRGGDGKTWLLRRLYRKVLERGDIPVLLDLKQWTETDYEQWKEWTSNEIGDAADFIVRRFGGIDLGAIDLDRLPPNASKILLVDGLNEITSAVGAQILYLLDELVRDQINLSVFVADRLIRRELPNLSRWSIGVVRPLTVAEVRKHLGNNIDVEPGGLLTSPFFLDASLKYGVEGHHRAQTSERFLTSHGGLPEADINGAAAAAFDAYKNTQSRMFDRSAFAELAGETATAALEHSSTLVSAADGRRYFVHHILHDYLSARHVAGLTDEDWTSQTLSALSFDSSSFDAIELVFEQLDAQRANAFLRKLYDWNLYAAGYALAQARDSDTRVGTEMRSVIFSMLAEKRFDAILSTRQKANDALMLMQLSDARVFQEAHSLEAVKAALAAVESGEKWFLDWRSLFQAKPDSELSPQMLAEIRRPDSIIGWTMANVAKRTVVSEQSQGHLVDWIHDERDPTVRWRIAHVLGAFPNQTTLETLLGLLDNDTDGSVRYGAIRSIVELGARAERELRTIVCEHITRRAEAISKQPKISGELRTCLLMDKKAVPPDWLSFVAQIVRALFVVTDSTNERDLWRQCLGTAENLYSNDQKELPVRVSSNG